MNKFINISEIIFQLGGTGVVSKLLNANPSTVSNWKKNNKIPKSHLPKFYELINSLKNSKNEYSSNGLCDPLNSNDFFSKKILIIISGGIACYKILELLRMLYKEKYNINVILTESAQKFVTPLMISSLINRKCFTNLFSADEGENMNHINLARNNDLILVAPCTANFLAKFSNGLADDLATSVLLATNNKILVAPSMNPYMWENQATQNNIKILKNRGIEFIKPDNGITACGEKGIGRLPENDAIFKKIKKKVNNTENNYRLANYRVVITAGPTQENIDPIRFISNNSSGKQGFALAKEFKKNGAEVTLISGPTNLIKPSVDKFIEVCSAEDMLAEVKHNINCDIFVGAAAVCDWKFVPYDSQNNKILSNIKIKKNKEVLFKTLKNPDILKFVGCHPNRPNFVVGFAAETNDIIKNAQKKLNEKKLDLIVANEINSDNRVFGSNFNKVILIDNNNIKESSRDSKSEISKLIVSKIYNSLSKCDVKSIN